MSTSSPSVQSRFRAPIRPLSGIPATPCRPACGRRVPCSPRTPRIPPPCYRPLRGCLASADCPRSRCGPRCNAAVISTSATAAAACAPFASQNFQSAAWAGSVSVSAKMRRTFSIRPKSIPSFGRTPFLAVLSARFLQTKI